MPVVVPSLRSGCPPFESCFWTELSAGFSVTLATYQVCFGRQLSLPIARSTNFAKTSLILAAIQKEYIQVYALWSF